MRDRAKLDRNSLDVLAHLEAYVNGDEPPNSALVSEYITFLEADHSVVSGGSDMLENAVLTSFVPLLSRILNSDLYVDVYARLLQAMLEQLAFGDTLKFFPPDAVVSALHLPANAVVYMAIHILRLGLARNDADVVVFLLESPALQTIVKRVLAAPELPTNIVSDTEESVRLFSAQPAFDVAPWRFLGSLQKSDLLQNATILARYLSLVELLALNSQKVPHDFIALLADFDMHAILTEDPSTADPFVSSLLIAFYSSIVLKVPLAVISKPIDQIVQTFVVRRQLHQYDFIVDPALNALFATLSHASGETQEYVKAQTGKSRALTEFDFSSADDVRFFCKLDLAVVHNKQQFFDGNFGGWSLQRVSYPQFCCLLHLVDNLELFAILAASGKVSDETLAKLPQNLIYEFLEKVSQYDYSSVVLLRDYPYILLTHLMASDPSIVNPEIWQAKQQTLQNLLLYRKVDLGVWHQGFSDCYREMLHGRQTKAVEPKVDVTDEAMG